MCRQSERERLPHQVARFLVQASETSFLVPFDGQNRTYFVVARLQRQVVPGKVTHLQICSFHLTCGIHGRGEKQFLDLGCVCNDAPAVTVRHGRKISAQKALLPDEWEDSPQLAALFGDQVMGWPLEYFLKHVLPGPTVIARALGVV